MFSLQAYASNNKLAYAKKNPNESAALLDSSSQQQQVQQTRSRRSGAVPPSSLNLQPLGPQSNATPPLGGPNATPKCSRFEQLIKTLVGRKVSRDVSTSSFIQSPEIRITKSPSEHTLIKNEKSTSTVSLNAAVQQKLWSVVPLLRREDSCASLHESKSSPMAHHSGLKKCDTVLALSRSSSNLEPIRPQNRLRNSSSSTISCSRCSSLLSLAANGSRYSLNHSNGGFVSVASADTRSGSVVVPTPTAAIPKVSSTPMRSSIGLHSPAAVQPAPLVSATAVAAVSPHASTLLCKLCLGGVTSSDLTVISQCGCLFCTECMVSYVEFEILEGAYDISCPDALCPTQGALTLEEIAKLSPSSLLDKHNRYRLNREVELDKKRTWCPRAGCETVCTVATTDSGASTSVRSSLLLHSFPSLPCSVMCPTCLEEFCSACKKTWHPTLTCEENTRQMAADGHDINIGIPFDNDLIKCCPMCAVPIEKDEGCAQMMCKRCKHVFCWYCLASLDDDFLLRHYDRGPCKNKLGHSRASVVWHRAQVIGIFAGFGILLLVASPLLLLAAPCIVCCKCRICSGAAKLEENESDFEEITTALHR